MRFGLKKTTLDAVNGVFSGFSQVEEAVLYGSRAKGNYKPGSDIDLTLKGDGLTDELVHKMEWEIDDLLLPYLFDLSIYTQIESLDLIEHIGRVGEIFYKKGMK